MKAKSIGGIIFTVFVVMLLNSACGNKATTPSPAATPTVTATVTGVYVAAIVESRDDRTNNTRASVVLRNGNSGGTVITNGQVSVNDTSLVYDAVSNSYTASLPFLTGGTYTFLAVTTAAGSAFGSVSMPYPVAITSPIEGSSFPFNTQLLTLTFTVSSDTQYFELTASKRTTPYSLASGWGDIKQIYFSPSFTGYGYVTMTVNTSNPGALSGAAAGSFLKGYDSGGQAVYNFY